MIMRSLNWCDLMFKTVDCSVFFAEITGSEKSASGK